MCFMENGEDEMNVLYNDKTDLLYIRFDDKRQDVITGESLKTSFSISEKMTGLWVSKSLMLLGVST